jgi:hypothetical protein
VGLLAAVAEKILRQEGGLDVGDLAERLKWFAAQNALEYSDTPAGCDSPIEKAITIAERRTGDPYRRFGEFRRRR